MVPLLVNHRYGLTVYECLLFSVRPRQEVSVLRDLFRQVSRVDHSLVGQRTSEESKEERRGGGHVPVSYRRERFPLFIMENLQKE